MGDAVRRVQRHLQALARDNFARLEVAHSTNVDWLRAELAALTQDVGISLRVELKRPLPATFRSEYAFAAKRARVKTPPPPPRSVTDHPTVTEPPKAVETVAVAPKKKTKTTVVKRTRRVLRPKPAVVKQPKERRSHRSNRLDPVTMKVVELRAELRRRGWKSSGVKAVLVDRLLAAMVEDDESDEEEDEEESEEGEDAVLELEEVDEEYDEEVEVEVAMEEEPEPETEKDGRDEIVRESLDLLSQRSTLDEGERPTLAEDASASKKRPQGALLPPLDERGEATETTQTADDTRDEEEEDAHSTSTTDAVGFAAAPVATTRAASEPLAPDVRVTKSAAKWAFLAGALRHNVSSTKSRALDEGAARPTDDASDVAIDASNSSAVADSPEATATMGVGDRTSRTTDDESTRPVERKASLKVSFVAKKAETATTVSNAQAAVPEPGQLLPEDPVSRLRSISLPQASVSAADPVTPNGQRTTGELPLARSEPNETDEQRQHQLTIEQEAQRLRIAAKLSAKKRFEEAMLSSSFWAKRDRLKASQQPQVESVAPQPREAVGATESTLSVPTLSIKLEPESEASTTEPRFMEAASPSRDASAVLLKPELAARSQSVKVPFASSSRRFSDPSRRVSALRRRESASSRRDSTSSRRDSVSSRRNSLTRRRDSGSSTLSSDDIDKMAATIATAAGLRKPLNLVSGLHSFTSLLEKENATASGASAAGSARSAPVVNALKQAEKSRLLEQKKTLEKLKRKEALMKKYEEQRKLDDDKKKKAVSVKEKAERDAKLKREQDKLNEKKQRELELAKRRHQKLQEMRAGLEKKRAMMAAEKQAGATAKLAAASSAASSSTLSSVSSKAVVRPAPASQTQTQKPFVAASTSQAPPTKPAMATVHAAGVVAKPVKPSASVPALKATVATHAAKPVAPPPPPPAKHRPTETSTYDMSDNAESSGSDDDDADSDDESKANKKNIPRWARKENLERILRVQFGPNASDPSPAIFPDFVDTCDLEAIFEPTDVRKKKRFQKRSSSGNWFGDRPTAREKAVYKRDMGYLR